MEDITNEGNQSGLLKRTRKITRVPIFNQDLIDENREQRYSFPCSQLPQVKWVVSTVPISTNALSGNDQDIRMQIVSNLTQGSETGPKLLQGLNDDDRKISRIEPSALETM